MRPEFPEKDQALRDDVGRLGALVGDMLRAQEGEEFFKLVESTRQAAVSARAGDAGAVTRFDSKITAVTPALREKLVRAFSVYFDAVNMAEQIHRLRRRREYERGGIQPNSPEWVLNKLKVRGFSAAQAEAMLERLVVEPVFTAHPTEAVRRTLLTKQQRIARALVDRIDPTVLTPTEEARAWARIREEVTASWQTEAHLSERPTLSDEAAHVLFYLRVVIYRIIPPLHEAWESAFQKVYGQTPNLGAMVRFGNWVGGDMDGNPNVNATTMRATLETQRDEVLRLYQAEVETLIERLSQSEHKAGFSDALRQRIKQRAAEFPRAVQNLPDKHADMPYRVLLHCVHRKLGATFRSDTTRYVSPGEFVDDLVVIADSLRAHNGAEAGLHHVTRLIRRAQCFGFHFATLDIRQDSDVLRRVLASLQEKPGTDQTDPEVASNIEVFRVIRELFSQYGPAAIGPYIISMAHSVQDVQTVLHLATRSGLSVDSRVPLDIAPLFETVNDLQAAAGTLESMLKDEQYREHLRARGDVQYVMLGYSDSGKDSGIGSARWALYRAQEELVKVAQAAKIRLVLFHGRGGTTSRGGTKITEAIPAQPPGSVGARLRVTEQGEIINGKFGLRGIAQRTLEVATGAVLKFSLIEQNLAAPDAGLRAIMDTIADASRSAYRKLVYDDPRLFEYFQLATPLDVITRMRIGSRPASRREQRGIQDLRAIPWVFAWTQARLSLPGWYGIADGLAAAIDKHGAKAVNAAAREWPVLRTLLGDVEMVLAKSDLGIAARYAALAGTTGNSVFPELKTAFERTLKLVCEVSGIKAPLDNEPWLARAIRLRNPYIDPMSLLQIEMIKEWRAGDRKDAALENALFTSIKGIARGLMNTG